MSERTVHQVLAELEMCSQVAAVNLEPSGRDAGEDIGGKCPPGGIDRKEDRQRENRILHSAEHFRRQLARGRHVHYVLEEAEEVLAAYRRPPAPKDKEHPMPGDFNFKRWVAESSLEAKEIARKCFISKRRVNQIRAKYREAA